MSPEQLSPWLVEQMTRRTLFRHGARLAGAGVALGAFGGTTAFAGSAADQIVMMNYPGWMGKTTVADFKKQTGIGVKQVNGLTSGISAAAAQVSQNKGSYDMSLGGPVLAAQLEEGEPAADGRLLEDPEHQERRQALPRRVSLGPADRLRQDRLRLSQGSDLRAPDQLGRPLDARQEVLRQGHAARLRRRHPRRGAQVQGLLDQLGQREAAERGPRRPARAEAACAGVPADRFREAAAEGDGRDRGRLRLRHRARTANEQEHRLGLARGGDARLPRRLARRRRARRTCPRSRRS